tara:strand:- start:1957 stop:4386 length:2430 start_codon:yes stop_codon:yes gene_type:complete
MQEEAFEEYVSDNFDDDEGETRSLDYRARKVGLWGNWMERVGHGQYVRWEKDEATELYRLVPVMSEAVVEDGVTIRPALPVVPRPVTLMEYVIKCAIGHPSCPKGGDPEYMSGPWYKRRFGKPIGESMGKQKQYGRGAYADTKYCFVTIEQTVSAIAKWLDEALHRTGLSNPARNPRLEKIMKKMCKKLGRARKHSPAQFEVAYLEAVVDVMDLDNTEEVLITAYEAKNLVRGSRAADEWLLDLTDVEFQEAAPGRRSGATFKPVVSKNNREGTDRPYGVPCPSTCTGDVQRGEDGRWVRGCTCPVHLLKHARVLQARDAGVAVEELESAVFADCLRIEKLPSGATLVRTAEGSAAEKAPPLVMVVTAAEEAQGIFYDGTLPFTRGAQKWRPPMRGVWFEIAGKGYAVRAWATAEGVTWRMRKQLRKTNVRKGEVVIDEATIQRLSSRSLRIAIATILSRADAPEVAMAENGDWANVSQAYTYVRSYEPLALQRRNLSDIVLGRQSWDAAAGQGSATVVSATVEQRSTGASEAVRAVVTVLPVSSAEVALAEVAALEREAEVEAGDEGGGLHQFGEENCELCDDADAGEMEEEAAVVPWQPRWGGAARQGQTTVTTLVRRAAKASARAADPSATVEEQVAARATAEKAVAAAQAMAAEKSRLGSSGTKFVPCHINFWVRGAVFKRERVNSDVRLRTLLRQTLGAGMGYVETQKVLCAAGYHTKRKEIEDMRGRQPFKEMMAVDAATAAEEEVAATASEGDSLTEARTEAAALVEGGGSGIGELQPLGEMQALEDMPVEEFMDLAGDLVS